MRLSLAALLVALAATAHAQAAGDSPLQVSDGDRIVLLGNTLIERDRHFGQFETMLRSRLPGRRFSVRNLAWPGDTTAVQLRPLNYGSIEQHLTAARPNIVMLSYGTNEAFDGPDGLKAFIEGYNQILDTVAKTGARVVFISPTPYEPRSAPQPAIRDLNDRIKLYVDATRQLAQQRGAVFVDLFTPLAATTQTPLTENGVHLSQHGYEAAAEALGDALGLGKSRLGPAACEKLRQAVMEKETLWFYRYRAHNAEYIYGRRSEKSGGNAGNPTFPAEFAEFDRMIQRADAQISELSTGK